MANKRPITGVIGLDLKPAVICVMIKSEGRYCRSSPIIPCIVCYRVLQFVLSCSISSGVNF